MVGLGEGFANQNLSAAAGREPATGAEVKAVQFRFTEVRDGRGDGLAEVDLVATDLESVLAEATTLGLPVDNQSVAVCGTVLNFAGSATGSDPQ